jgi:hypothetical protein
MIPYPCTLALSPVYNPASAAGKVPVPTVSGTRRNINANTWRTRIMEEPSADGTKKSSLCPSTPGTGTQPSEPDAAALLTKIASEFSGNSDEMPNGLMVGVDAKVLVSLMLLFIQLRGYTFSSDKVWLATSDARMKAKKLGIEGEEFSRVVEVMEKYGGALAMASPISGLFMTMSEDTTKGHLLRGGER